MVKLDSLFKYTALSMSPNMTAIKIHTRKISVLVFFKCKMNHSSKTTTQNDHFLHRDNFLILLYKFCIRNAVQLTKLQDRYNVDKNNYR